MDTQSSDIPRTGAFADAVRNPSNPNHLMVIKPIANRVRVYVGDTRIADTTNAVRVVEVGRSVYDPMLYVPVADLTQTLDQSTRTTRCPLKGDAKYSHFEGEEIGWSYDTFDFADRLAEHMGFWPAKVRVVEGE